MSTISYAIQGKRNGEWTTLFTPFETAAQARAMMALTTMLGIAGMIWAAIESERP